MECRKELLPSLLHKPKFGTVQQVRTTSEGIKDQEAYTLLQNPYGFSGVGNRHEPKGIKGTVTGRSFDDEQQRQRYNST